MKRIITAIILAVFCFCITSCDMQNAKYINLSSKPNVHYYSDCIYKKVLSNQNYKLYIFDTNLYKDILVEKDDNEIIENFFNSITPNDFVNDVPEEKEIYRLKIIFDDNSKYVIRVYNASLVKVSPWDGNYDEDTISMANIPLRYNLLDFCNHVHNKPISK